MTRSVAAGIERGDAGRDLLTPFVFCRFILDGVEYAMEVLEVIRHEALCAAHIALVGPERPIERRYLDFGLGKRGRAIGGANAIDVVGMKVRQNDDVDLFWIDTGGGHVEPQKAHGP